MSISIKTFFDPLTSTLTHVVNDASTKKAAVIDPVLNYDQYSGGVSTKSAEEVISYIHKNELVTEWILETHIHADHITAAYYLKEKLGGKIGIGSGIKEVLAFWVPVFNTFSDTKMDGSQFDQLFDDNQVIKLGDVDIRVLHTPGHTSACVSYIIEDAVFVGDTLFMPDVGTARTDFPGGSAETIYNSIKKILSLPDNTRIFMCHDYPTLGREVTHFCTVKEQNEKNVLINNNVSKDEYIELRNKRNEKLDPPKLLLPSIQINLRAGLFGRAEENNMQYIKIPIGSNFS